ncbi:unnamed protein product [Bubo scandiacus]
MNVDSFCFQSSLVHSSLGSLVTLSSLGITILMLALVRTPARHSTLQPTTPGLKQSGKLSLPGSWDCRPPLHPENSMSTASWAALGGTLVMGERLNISILGDIQNSAGCSPGQPALADPT